MLFYIKPHSLYLTRKPGDSSYSALPHYQANRIGRYSLQALETERSGFVPSAGEAAVFAAFPRR